MNKDLDDMIGFWLKGLPYIWIEGETWEECMRFYLVDDQISAVFDEDNHTLDGRNISSYINFKMVSPKKKFSLFPFNKDCLKVRDKFLIYLFKDNIDREWRKIQAKDFPFEEKLLGDDTYTPFPYILGTKYDIRIEGQTVPPDFSDWRRTYSYYLNFHEAKYTFTHDPYAIIINPSTDYSFLTVTYPWPFGNVHKNPPWIASQIIFRGIEEVRDRSTGKMKKIFITRKYFNLKEVLEKEVVQTSRKYDKIPVTGEIKDKLAEIHTEAVNPTNQGWAYPWALELKKLDTWRNILNETQGYEFGFRLPGKNTKLYKNMLEVILDHGIKISAKTIDRFEKLIADEDVDTLSDELSELATKDKKLDKLIDKIDISITEFPPKLYGWVYVGAAMEYYNTILERYRYIDELVSRVIFAMLAGDMKIYQTKNYYRKK
jgi:hypothetical protein